MTKLRNYAYSKSEELLERALKSIPLGTQTYSKSKTQFPLGVSPYYIERAEGSRITDVDGNEFIDFANALNAITLGYNHPEVTAAVRAMLESGVIFSLPHPIEIDVSEKICEMVPCAEMVRFGKNGSDATTAAVRASRAYTGRDHIAVCGYHGWQDWSIGTTSMDKGVPLAVKALSHTFEFNDLASLTTLFRSLAGEIACVIMEPMHDVFPAPGFLEGVKELAHSNDTLLIFDEMITGFRFANGGAQEYFNVTPDIATFGKGLANGYPLSAIAGRAEVMKMFEEVFFSFTFGGETLSLAAAQASMTVLQREPVVETLAKQGQKIIDGLETMIASHGLGEVVSVRGHPCWSFLHITDSGEFDSWQIRTLFLQELFSRGILTYGTHNLSFAHSDTDIEFLLTAYDEVLTVLKTALETGSLGQMLRCDPLTPLFTVR